GRSEFAGGGAVIRGFWFSGMDAGGAKKNLFQSCAGFMPGVFCRAADDREPGGVYGAGRGDCIVSDFSARGGSAALALSYDFGVGCGGGVRPYQSYGADGADCAFFPADRYAERVAAGAVDAALYM